MFHIFDGKGLTARFPLARGPVGSSLTGASIREEVVLPSGTSSTTIGSYSTVELFSGARMLLIR